MLPSLKRIIFSRWTPKQLFSGGRQGVWYGASYLESNFQVSDGTVDPVVDSPIGYLADKSGNGNHAIQATAANRPTLKYDTNFYLLFDGSNDTLQALFALNQPYTRISALRQTTWTSTDTIFSGGNLDADLAQSGTTPQLLMYAGASGVAVHDGAALGVNAVVTEVYNGAASRLAVNTGAYNTGDAGANAPGGITLGGYFGAGFRASVRIYEVIEVAGVLSETEIMRARKWVGLKAGLAL